jgi:signal transduction histidine kinase
VEALLFRASREALRNVERHSRAGRVRVRVRSENGVAVLEVEDDGVGCSSENGGTARADGHIGLSLLRDLAGDTGGTLVVDSVEGRGTKMRMEVPFG